MFSNASRHLTPSTRISFFYNQNVKWIEAKGCGIKLCRFFWSKIILVNIVRFRWNLHRMCKKMSFFRICEKKLEKTFFAPLSPVPLGNRYTSNLATHLMEPDVLESHIKMTSKEKDDDWWKNYQNPTKGSKVMGKNVQKCPLFFLGHFLCIFCKK